MNFDTYFYLSNYNNNFNYNLNTIEHFSLENIEGPQGNTGNRGYTGPRGVQGLQGRRGILGKQGVKGDPGSQGYRGLAGNIGDTGNPGGNGVKGPTGYQGFIGPKGLFGSRGPQGPKGKLGVIGTPGRQGYSGNKGANGSTGSSGEKIPGLDEPIQKFNFGVKFMTGFGTKNEEMVGQTTNPIDKRFTAPYKYTHNVNKHIKCPPNSYLTAFGYARKGKDTSSGAWCNESATFDWRRGKVIYDDSNKNKECKVGWNSRDNLINGKTYQWNKQRSGMPYVYGTDCARLK